MAVEFATLLLHDRDVLLRANACCAVADLALVELRTEVEQLALSDPDWLVRADAVETLGEMGDRAALSVLYSVANDPDENVRAYTAISLGLLGTEDDEPWLAKWAGRESSERVRNEIHAARSRLGSGAGWDAFLNSFATGESERIIELLLTIVSDLLDRRTPECLLRDPTRLLLVLRTEAASGRALTAMRAGMLAERLERAIAEKPAGDS
jgi:hypothetical protein